MTYLRNASAITSANTILSALTAVDTLIRITGILHLVLLVLALC